MVAMVIVEAGKIGVLYQQHQELYNEVVVEAVAKDFTLIKFSHYFIGPFIS